MSQTDRQTDKATHWKSAIFDCNKPDSDVKFSDQWKLLDTLPPFVKEVHRQKEICPETQRPHFQVHVVCYRQVRLSQMTSWIKHTKWFPVIGEKHIENSIKYTSKSDTAVEGTHQVIQGEKYFQIHELLLEVAKQYLPEDFHKGDSKDFIRCREWKHLTSRLVRQDLAWTNKLSNPVLEKCWKLWGEEFLQKASEYLEETCGAYIIEGPASEAPAEECLIE